jgi:4-azaleucine resistance transporter AzlC
MKEFFRGISRALGVGVGYLPIAMSFGAVSIQSGLSDTAAVGMSLWVYAGAAQFAALEGVRQNLSWLSIVLTMLLMNLRHIPMSLATKGIFSDFSRGQQLVLFHGLTDEAFALDLSDKPRGQSQPKASLPYYVGIHLFCWASWVIGTWLGCKLGSLLPERWLQFALPSLFLYLLSDGMSRYWSRDVLVLLGVGIALVLATQQLGAFGVLMSIIGVAALASFLPGLDKSTRSSS